MVTLRCIWGFVLLALLSTGCAPGVVAAAPIAPSPCPPEAASWNPYNTPTNGLARYIYDNQAKTANSRQEAFGLLVHEVRQWSDHVDVLSPDNRVVRIMVTFISRGLMESVVLNQILENGNSINPDFNTNVEYALQDVVRREELLLLVTITASEYRNSLLPADALAVQLPLDEMLLINSENLSIKPGHRDGFLMYEIDLHGTSAHGYIAYPVAVKVDEHCHAVLDERWDTSLSLHVPRFYINQVDHGQRTWNMDYHPAVEMSDSIDQYFNPPPPTSAEADFSPSPDAPLVESGSSVLSDKYWIQMSRFVWYHVLEAIHH